MTHSQHLLHEFDRLLNGDVVTIQDGKEACPEDLFVLVPVLAVESGQLLFKITQLLCLEMVVLLVLLYSQLEVLVLVVVLFEQ